MHFYRSFLLKTTKESQLIENVSAQTEIVVVLMIITLNVLTATKYKEYSRNFRSHKTFVL